jgi:hypothetical protein
MFGIRRGDYAPAALVSGGMAFAVALSWSSATAQSASDASSAWTVPRTPWGDPDLQGVYTNIDELNIPLERPARFEGRLVSDISPEELASFARESNEQRQRAFEQNNAFRGLTAVDRFDLRPSRPWRIIDPPAGRVPALTSEGQERQAAYAASVRQPADRPDSLTLWYRCISLGVPGTMLPSVDGAPYRIVQAPGIVAIAYERMHESRVIPTDGRAHVANVIRMYAGDARGRWEGESLVVETTNFKARFLLTSAASDKLRVIERFTPLSPDALEWSVTFDDASAWTSPWSIAMRLTRTVEAMFEDACHEGNHTVRNILSGARADERASAARSRGP